MIEEELLQNDELIDEINEKEKLRKNERINPERYMECVYYCNLTGEECEGDDCSTCHIAREEIVGDVHGDVLGRYPTIKKHADDSDIEFFTNMSNTVMEFKSVKDLMIAPKLTWLDKLDTVKELSDEVLERYGYWNTIKKVCLQSDEVVEYWYLKDYPLVIVCKNATFLVAPSVVDW